MSITDVIASDALFAAQNDRGETVIVYRDGNVGEGESIDALVFRVEPEVRDDEGRIHECTVALPKALLSWELSSTDTMEVVIREGESPVYVRVTTIAASTPGWWIAEVAR